VPELKATAVTEERLTELQYQAKTLEAQHKELGAEISEIQSRFETKKRKWQDSFSEYEVSLAKLCKSPLLDDDLRVS
jgi:predicted RNase H-like nuclease (RuvC/YqgF family)